MFKVLVLNGKEFPRDVNLPSMNVTLLKVIVSAIAGWFSTPKESSCIKILFKISDSNVVSKQFNSVYDKLLLLYKMVLRVS